MNGNRIFARKKARRLREDELQRVGGAILMAHTMQPGSCAVGGGNDWIEVGEDPQF